MQVKKHNIIKCLQKSVIYNEPNSSNCYSGTEHFVMCKYDVYVQEGSVFIYVWH